MLHEHPTVEGFSRLGAIGALILYLLDGLSPSLSYGHSIGDLFAHGMAGTPLEGVVFNKLMIGLGTLLGGLAGLMLFLLLGALAGSALGAVLVRYVMVGGNRRPPGKGVEAEGKAPETE